MCPEETPGERPESGRSVALVVLTIMNCIDEVKKKLEKYSSLEWDLEGSTISVSPEGGFTVWLTESDVGCTVGYNGWHEEFSDKEQALECFAFGLSERCRLKVFSRGNTEYKWVMESFENGNWISYSTTALIFVPFWLKKSIVYLQNIVIRS